MGTTDSGGSVWGGLLTQMALFDGSLESEVYDKKISEITSIRKLIHGQFKSQGL